MKVTPVFVTPPKGAEGYPQLTPELTAAVFARYSRSNEGLAAILAKIDPKDADKSVDAVFKFVDYGHASIGGMAGGVGMTLDGVSMWLAYKIFEIMQMADGQESSTRYITQDITGLMEPEAMGIPPKMHAAWRQLGQLSFAAYQKAYGRWEKLQQENPAATMIKEGIPDKVRTRLVKNFALDRARFMLLFGLKTNVAAVASARIWVETVRHLASLPQVEAQTAANLIREKLALFAPRLIKHSTAEASFIEQANIDLSESLADLRAIGTTSVPDSTYVAVQNPQDNPFWTADEATGFHGKQNRYSRHGAYYRRTQVRFSWNNLAIAELRDLNRHRTGHRQSLLSQRGIYYGPTKLAAGLPSYHHEAQEAVTAQVKGDAQELVAAQAAFLAQLVAGRSPAYVYALLFGSQSPFEHVCTADKFLYEVELRTGLGAHYRYAEHLASAAEQFFRQEPHSRDHVQLGLAEPE